MPIYKICSLTNHAFNASGVGLVKIYFSANNPASVDTLKNFTLYVKKEKSIYDNMIKQIKEWISTEKSITIDEDENNTNVVSKIFIDQNEVYCLTNEINK